MTSQPDRIRNRLLTLIAFILVIAALRWSYPVTMPLVVTFFIIAAAWPLKLWLERVLPSRLSNIGTIVLLFLVLAAALARAGWFEGTVRRRIHGYAGLGRCRSC